jgi:hypothetical protein
MILSGTFLLSGGLFDFDLTLFAEAILFLFLSLIVTFLFINPISQQLEDRYQFVDYTLFKSSIILNFSSKNLSTCIELLTTELDELSRQFKITKEYTNSIFESEINIIQKENIKLLSKLKNELSLKSAYKFTLIVNELSTITNKFFAKKFHSIS